MKDSGSHENKTVLDYSLLQKQYQALKRKEHYLEIINDFAFRLNDLYTVDEVVWEIAKNVIAKLNFVDCVIYLLDKKRNVLIQKAAHGPKNPEKLDIYNPIIIPIGEGVVGTVAATKKAEIVYDTRKDKRYIVDDSARLSELSVPIIYEDKVIGVIDSEHPEVGFYTQEHLDILTTVSAMAATKIMHAKALEKLKDYQNNLEYQIASQTVELRQTIDSLQRSNQDLEQFAYAASHDLKEPLRTISSYLQLLEKKDAAVLSDESKEYLHFAVDGAKRMNDLLSGLLEYSRLKKTKEEFIEIDTQQIIEVVKANLFVAIKVKQAEIICHDLPPIQGNRTQIIQLFQNMIANAIKFCKKDIAPHIVISSRIIDDKVCLKIQDNGVGIASEYFDKIFKLFARVGEEGYEGSGIGLALCKRIIEYHGGTIEVESEHGQGTIFLFTLPSLSSIR